MEPAAPLNIDRFLNLDSVQLPGVRNIVWSREGDIFAGTLSNHVQRFKRGDKLVDRHLSANETKSIATDRLRSLRLSLDDSQLFLGVGNYLYCLEAETLDILWMKRATDILGFVLTSPHSIVPVEDGIFVSYDSGRLEKRTNEGTLMRSKHDSNSPHDADVLAKTGQIVGTDLSALVVWNENLRQQWRYIPDSPILASAFDGNALAALRVDRSIIIVDAAAGRELSRFDVHPGMPAMAFNPEKELISYVEGLDVVTAFFDGKEYHRQNFEGIRPLCLKYNWDGNELAVGCDDGEIRILSDF